VDALDSVPRYGVHARTMRTGHVASRAGVNTETLRYYERRGLLPTPQRRESGYRDYGSDAVGTVRFIRRAQAVGFSLDEIESLLGLANGGPESIDAVRELAQRRMAELDRKLADLQAIRTALTQLVDTCDRPRAERKCPLLQIAEVEDERPHHRTPGSERTGAGVVDPCPQARS